VVKGKHCAVLGLCVQANTTTSLLAALEVVKRLLEKIVSGLQRDGPGSDVARQSTLSAGELRQSPL